MSDVAAEIGLSEAAIYRARELPEMAAGLAQDSAVDALVHALMPAGDAR